MSDNFKIIKKDVKSRARLGVLTTPHGVVKTPSYVIVATYGQIRHLSPADIEKTKTQILICNTYHLWPEVLAVQRRPLSTRLNRINRSFLLNKLGVIIPTMTDSGGFQVFSLAFGNNSEAKKIFPTEISPIKQLERKNIKITSKGVYFRTHMSDIARRTYWKFLGPELSMKIQKKLGANIIFAFDECTSFFDNFKYNKKAMERTHKWALECLNIKTRNDQTLFGIVQGGKYKQLRIQSAKYIGSLPFDGFGIGGSFGKEEMVKMLRWVIPHLPEEKPRHLLGVGRIEDIFQAAENGVDLFDCVIPTREARHGRLYTKTGHIDIRRGKYSNDTKVIEKNCGCPTCKSEITRSKIRELIKNKDRTINATGQRWCLLHNIWFFNNLLEEIRSSIQKDKFLEFKNKYLKKLKY